MSSKASKSAQARQREQRAAELLAEQERQRKRANLRRAAIVGGVVALVVVATLVISVISNRDDDVVASPAGSSDYGLVVGDLDAPREIVVYEDFLCPICGTFEAAAGEELAAAAAAGDVVLDFRPISILGRIDAYSEESLNAFLVVRDVAGDEVAKEFHDLLYDDQPSEEGPFPDDDWLVEKAVQAGADEDAVRPGIENGERLDDVQAATDEATEAGVGGTPTVLLDGVVFREGGSWEEIGANLVEEVS